MATRSARLNSITELIDPCRCAYDIGADHAYLAIALIERGICQTACATDLRAAPLERASKHIAEAQLQTKIQVRQTDGLDGLSIEPTDCLIIAGMGGLQMIDILNRPEALRQLAYGQQIVLQPNWTWFELRHWLARHGFDFISETLVRERGKIYCNLNLRYRGQAYELSDLAAFVGPLITAADYPRSDLLTAYLSRLKRLSAKRRISQENWRTIDEQLSFLLKS